MLMLTIQENWDALPPLRTSFAKKLKYLVGLCVWLLKSMIFLTDYSGFSFLTNYKHLSKTSKIVIVI